MLTASTDSDATATQQHNMIVEAEADQEAEAEATIESKPSEEEDKENLTENSDIQNPGEKDPKDDEPAEDDLCTLWVGQLHKNVTEEILYELFLQAGPIISARIPNDKEGKRRTFGFVEYVYDVSVPYAMALFEGTKLFGREIRMNSKNPERVNMEKIRREMALMIHQNQRQKLAATMNNPQPYMDVAHPRLVPEATIPRPLLPCPPPLQKLPLLPLPLLDNCQRPRPLLDNAASWQAPASGRGLMGPYPGAMGLRTLMDVGSNGETWPPLMFQPRPRETNAPNFLLRPGPCGASGPNERTAVRASCVTRPLLTQRTAHYSDDPRRYTDMSQMKADRRSESGTARPILSVKASESNDKDEPQTANRVPLNSVSETKNHGAEKSDTAMTKDCGNTKSNCSDLQKDSNDQIADEKNSKENDDSKKSVVVKLKDDNVITVSISCDVQNFKDAKIKLEKVEIEDLDEVESRDKIDKITKVEKSVQLENSINIENTVKVENSGKRNKTLSYNVSDDDSKTDAKKDRDVNRFYDPPHIKEEKDFTHATRIDVKSAVYSNSAYKSTESLHEVDRPAMTLKGKVEENGKERAFIRWADRLLESQGKTPDGGFVFRKSPSDRSVVDIAKSGDVPGHGPQKAPVDHPLQLLNSSLQSSLCDGNKNIDPIQAFVKMAESNKLKQIESKSACLQDPKPTPVFGKPVNNYSEQGKVDHVTGSKSTKLNDVSEQLKSRDVSAIKSAPAVAEVGRMKTYSQVLNSNEAPKAENGIKSYSQVASKPPADKVLLTRDPQKPKQILGASGEGKATGSFVRCRDAMAASAPVNKVPEGRDSLLRKANSNVLRDVKLFKDKLNHSNKEGSLVSNQPVINATEKSHIVLEDVNALTKKEQEFPQSPPPFFRGADYSVPKKSYSPGDPCGIIDEIMRQGRPVEIITDCGNMRYMNQSCRPVSNGKINPPTNKFVPTRPPCDMRRDPTTKVYGGTDMYPPVKSAATTVLESASCIGVSRDGVCHLGRGRGRGQSRCLGQATLQGPCRRPTAPPPAPGYRR